MKAGLERVPLRYYGEVLRRYLAPFRLKAALLAVILLGDTALQLVNPQLLGRFIDTARSGGSSETLAAIAVLFLAVACGAQIVGSLATYLGQDVGWSATNLLRADLARHCLRLDMPFYKAHSPGELIARVDGDIALLSNFLSAFVVRVLGKGLLLAGVVAAITREDWRIGAALALYTLVALGALRRVQGVVAPSFILFRRAGAALSGFWEEALAGAEDIRSCGAEQWALGEQDRLLRDLGRDGRRSMVMGRVLQSVLEGLTAAGTALVFALGAYLLHAGTLTIGAVFIIFYYTTMVSGSLGDLTAQFNDAQGAAAGLARVREVLDTAPAIADGPGAVLPPGAPAVAFRAVSFRYDTGGLVLRDLTFRLEPDRALGLLGRTGSGKTTLARLLPRFYDPCAGTVLLGETDVRAMRLPELRRRIGMVTQDVQVLAATVRDNLTLFARGVSDDHLTRAIRDLGLEEWYDGLPHGLDTWIDPGLLSAGEAQLLALTRVFLREPDLVILDEASSRLDPATERRIEAALDRLLRGRTAIIVAHRLASVERADDILILDDGRILEYGARAALAADPDSHFARLLRAGPRELLA